MTERRCDGCAYWDHDGKPLDRARERLLACHHGQGYVRPDWWCNHFWPADVPLPEPWTGLGECVEVEP